MELTPELVKEFLSALPSEEEDEWYDSYQGFAIGVLGWLFGWYADGPDRPEVLTFEDLYRYQKEEYPWNTKWSL